MDAGLDNPEVNAALARLERELALMKDALRLLGLSACSRCGRYFAASDRSARFEWKDPVCLECLEPWWDRLRERLPVREREVVERRLVQWLVTYHGGKVTQSLPVASERDPGSLCIVAGCAQCDGRTQIGGERCRSCVGRGAVWVVVPRAIGKGHQPVMKSGA